MLDAGRLDLERADPVARGDDHVVRTAGIPVVAVLVLLRGVLGVEPLAPERLLGFLRAIPVAEGIVGIRPRPQADLTTLSPGDCALVLVEDLHVPPGHRLPHRAFANL